MSKEFTPVDLSISRKNMDQRLKNLEEFLKAALEGRSIDLARITLGKGFVTFTKVTYLGLSIKIIWGSLIL